ncbi:MAG: hypothetical protein B6I24_09450 [Bacteroidetes bacterium 4572_128]|nr:MAG: hypothetical protein B6I24_09450 [Bacteroidetes bacterium 4572_128]
MIEILYIFLISFFVAYVSIPSIVTISNLKNLYDKPNERNSHINATPTLGGLAIYAGLVLSLSLFCELKELRFIIASMTVIFFTGLKDDILVISPIKKTLGQIISGVILIYFLILLLINSYNLIDGIDGLSSGVGIITSSTFAIWFFLNGEFGYSMIGLSLAGTLMAFFRFNVFSKKKKIFMGDTGSLLVGLIIYILTVKFNEINIDGEHGISSAPALSFAILIIPLIDTLRIFLIRAINKKSPFKPDKNHIHHNLLDFGFSHLQVTTIILFCNLIFIILAFYSSIYLKNLGTSILFFIFIISGFLLSFLPKYMKNKKNL